MLNPSPSNYSFPCLAVLPFNHLDKVSYILWNESQKKDSLSFFIFDGLKISILVEFIFFQLDKVDNILSDWRKLKFDMFKEDHVHCSDKSLDT